ncbi:MAG TPA: PilZ domain-containing protein [Candidatus Melainabacteria bacterium]|nr:PilZ domain-containing protein [Candidatus Melainabacteria bacterium]HIN66443.1 PilZ domain-containing protein [Candidatus Obscuribacterales bacterium]
MFQKGKAYKVKVEASPGEVGFGRATIVDKIGEKILVQLKTSREANKVLPKGTRLWFVNESSENSFNGMWATSVLGAQLFSGRTALICSAPRLEALLQRRRTPRASLDVNASIRLEGDKSNFHIRTQDISSSGIALVSQIDLPANIDVGKNIVVNIEAKTGRIQTTCRVIRIEKNWLANKTVLGVEMIDMDDDSSENLMNLLKLLGLDDKPEVEKQPTTGKLFGWKGEQRGEKEDRSFIKKTGEISPPDVEPS